MTELLQIWLAYYAATVDLGQSTIHIITVFKEKWRKLSQISAARQIMAN